MRLFNWTLNLPTLSQLGLPEVMDYPSGSTAARRPARGVAASASREPKAEEVGDPDKAPEKGVRTRLRLSVTPPRRGAAGSADGEHGRDDQGSSSARQRAQTDHDRHRPLADASLDLAVDPRISTTPPPKTGTPPPSSSAPKSFANRVHLFETAIDQPVVDLDRLRELSTSGIPDKPSSLRATYWKILLGYLPLESSSWKETYRLNRELYKQFAKDFILDPSVLHQNQVENEDHSEADPNAAFLSQKVNSSSHPLSTDLGSDWCRYFADRKILNEIDKDARRTLRQFHFFNQLMAQTGQVNLDTASSDYNIYSSLVGVKRILFIYAKLNPGVTYVQGMNEILAPILYIMCMDVPVESLEDAEADAFFCFTNMMGELRDNFLRELDTSSVGIGSRMDFLRVLLHEKDPEVAEYLDSINMLPQYYSLRWITLLLSQDFQLPEIIRLWDSLLADAKRFDFLVYVCCAMVMLVRSDIIGSDFASILTMLQTYPLSDMNLIIKKARELYSKK